MIVKYLQKPLQYDEFSFPILGIGSKKIEQIDKKRWVFHLCKAYGLGFDISQVSVYTDLI